MREFIVRSIRVFALLCLLTAMMSLSDAAQEKPAQSSAAPPQSDTSNYVGSA